jgi:phage terminase small subunit
MSDPKITARITELRKPVIARAQMTRGEWLERITRVARADVRNMFDKFGNPIEIPELSQNEAAAVAGFEFTEEYEGKGESRRAIGVTKKFKLVDPIRALELIGKACHYYADRIEQTGPDGEPLLKTIEVHFVEPPNRPEEASQGATKDTDSSLSLPVSDQRQSSPRKS